MTPMIFSWQSAKASHAILLRRMEQGEISDWSQTDKIDRVRHAKTHKHFVAYDPVANGKKSKKNLIFLKSLQIPLQIKEQDLIVIVKQISQPLGRSSSLNEMVYCQ